MKKHIGFYSTAREKRVYISTRVLMGKNDDMGGSTNGKINAEAH